MKKLLEQYWKEANQHKELDPLNFEIEEFTERFMYKHRNALRLSDVVGQSEHLPCDECVDGQRWSPYYGKYVECDCRK